MLLTNTARVAGFLGILFVHDLRALIAVALLVAVSDRLFWVAHPALVAELASSGSRDRWFGLTTALRCAGLGIGGLLAGLAVSDLGIRRLSRARHRQRRSASRSRRCSSPPAGTQPRADLGGGLSSPRGLKAVLADRPFCGVVAINLVFGIARTVILVGLPVFTVQVLDAPAWLAGALYATYTAHDRARPDERGPPARGHRRTRALMFAAVLWAMSFLLLGGRLVAAPVLLAGFLFVVTGLYTVAVMLHAGVIDALVVEAAPDRLRARYVGVYHLSWAVANALAPGLFAFLLAWQPILPWVALSPLAPACGGWSVGAGGPARTGSGTPYGQDEWLSGGGQCYASSNVR